MACSNRENKMSFTRYDSKEEAYKAGYENGKLVGCLETTKIVIEKLNEAGQGGN